MRTDHALSVTLRRVVVSLRGRGQSPALPFACCIGSLRFCRPLRPVLLLVSFPRQQCPSVGALGVVLVVAGLVVRSLLPTPLRRLIFRHLPGCVSVGTTPTPHTNIDAHTCTAHTLRVPRQAVNITKQRTRFGTAQAQRPAVSQLSRVSGLGRRVGGSSPRPFTGGAGLLEAPKAPKKVLA